MNTLLVFGLKKSWQNGALTAVITALVALASWRLVEKFALRSRGTAAGAAGAESPAPPLTDKPATYADQAYPIATSHERDYHGSTPRHRSCLNPRRGRERARPGRGQGRRWRSDSTGAGGEGDHHPRCLCPGDVRRYGALGDGSADDSAAWRAALSTGHRCSAGLWAGSPAGSERAGHACDVIDFEGATDDPVAPPSHSCARRRRRP